MYNKSNRRKPDFRRTRIDFTDRFNRSKPRGGRGLNKVFDPTNIIHSSTTVKPNATHPEWPTLNITTEELIPISALKVNKQLVANLEAKNFDKLTPIQQAIIPLISEGKEVVGLANTGTGKTAAFLIPIIDKLMDRPAAVMVLTPTRELALQINNEFRDLTKNTRLRSALVIGGASMDRQIREIKQHPHFVIGTPGRIKDLNNRGLLKLGHVQHFVLDEADRMLDMGFIGDIRHILQQKSAESKTYFFSATLDKRVAELLREFSKDPQVVSVLNAETAKTVKQSILHYGSDDDKLTKLNQILSNPAYYKTLIFVRTKFGADKLKDKLVKHGHKVDSIHGDKRQSHRQRALKDFRDDKINHLVATDVAARGLDIKDVTHVINFDQPATKEDYVHRIGRTGRAGREGHAITFIKK
ncbi:MAG: DEAD/DEAH box helicase [Candidatus Doudnabacteria bacterium]|nr:DEAD/DEAH box helicase [Candidatus Doudnabacteria bacterium]